MYQTNMYEGMLAETIAIPGFQGRSDQCLFCASAWPWAVSGHGRDPPHARLG